MVFKKKKAIIGLLTTLLLIMLFISRFSYVENKNQNLASAQITESEKSSTLLTPPLSDADNRDYRQEMRDWVIRISKLSKKVDSDFLIIPQNCSELLTTDGLSNSAVQNGFINAIDGIGQEGLSYGYNRFNAETPDPTKKALTDQLKIASDNKIKVIALDYCKQDSKINQAREFNDSNGFIGFQSQNLELKGVPSNTPYHNNDKDTTNLNEGQNCLFLLNPQEFTMSEDFIQALSQTNYDIIVIDSFFEDNQMLSKEQVNTLKTKSSGSRRLVISYLSIGEAEDYRYYFDSSYHVSPPTWLLSENPHWQGNFIVKYWDPEWQSIIATGKDSYLTRIINCEFDGVYLDIVDGYQSFEQ